MSCFVLSSFNKKQLNPLFLLDSTLYEDGIPNCPFQRITYLVIYSNKSPYHAILGFHLYSFGGLILSDRESKNNSTKVWALYLTDPSQCWKYCPPMTHPRFDPTTTVLDSKTYVFGGSFK